MKRPPVYKDESGHERVCGSCFVKWARYQWRKQFYCKPCLESARRKFDRAKEQG